MVQQEVYFRSEIIERNSTWMSDGVWSSVGAKSLKRWSWTRINLDCAAYLSGHWAQLRYLAHWKNKEFMSDISFLELVPILMALFIWTPQFVNKKLLLRIDNQAQVFIINKRTSRSKFVIKLVRPMVMLLMSKNVHVCYKSSNVLQRGWPYECKTQIITK
jgi:hypothetical protein